MLLRQVASYSYTRDKNQGARPQYTRSIFEADDTDAVLLIDASNAFNSLNWAATLHNISVLCPLIGNYAINTYSPSARLFRRRWQRDNISRGNNSRRPTFYGTICSQHPALDN